MKPSVNNQGKVIIEFDSDDGYLILYPTGNIVNAGMDRNNAEKIATRWCKRNAKPNAINVAMIEWR